MLPIETFFLLELGINIVNNGPNLITVLKIEAAGGIKCGVCLLGQLHTQSIMI